MTDTTTPVWLEIRRADLMVLLVAAYAVLERATAQHPLPPRTWELAQAVEGAERALLDTVDAARVSSGHPVGERRHAETGCPRATLAAST